MKREEEGVGEEGTEDEEYQKTGELWLSPRFHDETDGREAGGDEGECGPGGEHRMKGIKRTIVEFAARVNRGLGS